MFVLSQPADNGHSFLECMHSSLCHKREFRKLIFYSRSIVSSLQQECHAFTYHYLGQYSQLNM